jgi:hypothetical protein
MKDNSSRLKAGIRICGDLCFGALIVLVIGLPIYIHFSQSKLSYTPEPKFPSSQTNSATSQIFGTK